MSRLLHCLTREIREGKIYAISFSPCSGDAVLSAGCWVDLPWRPMASEHLGMWGRCWSLGLMKYWHSQGEEIESMRTKVANFHTLGPWLKSFWHLSGPMDSGVTGWSNSVGQPHPGTIIGPSLGQPWRKDSNWGCLRLFLTRVYLCSKKPQISQANNCDFDHSRPTFIMHKKNKINIF